MSWGSNNELMIFPIIEIVRKEIKNMINNGQITLDQIYDSADAVGGSKIYSSLDKSTTNIVYNTELLAKLESNDFELVLEKNDTEKPNMLTGVIISFGTTLKEVISLIRQNGKLTNVKIAIVLREATNEKLSNPLGMSMRDYCEYVRNKKAWRYYTDLLESGTASQEDINKANIRIPFLEARNSELRSVYGLEDSRDMTIDDYMKYMPNALGMDTYDFVEYMRNARCWDFPEATQDEKNTAHEANIALRAKYVIPEDDYASYGTYEQLATKLPNPMGMHFNDFITYLDNIQEKVVLDPNDPEDVSRMLAIELENNDLVRRYYTEHNYDINLLESYRDNNTTVFEERVLLRILISLSYSKDGKLLGVKSETLEGG